MVGLGWDWMGIGWGLEMKGMEIRSQKFGQIKMGRQETLGLFIFCLAIVIRLWD